jgi:hypothetical protein
VSALTEAVKAQDAEVRELRGRLDGLRGLGFWDDRVAPRSNTEGGITAVGGSPGFPLIDSYPSEPQRGHARTTAILCVGVVGFSSRG